MTHLGALSTCNNIWNTGFLDLHRLLHNSFDKKTILEPIVISDD